jgi:hypothetical protein
MFRAQREQHQKQAALEGIPVDALVRGDRGDSSVKPVAKSAFFRTSSRSRTPHLGTTSALRASKPVGSSSLSSFGTVIHGSPLRVVTLTPPAEPSARPADNRSSPEVIRCFRPMMNSRASSGRRIAA